jgi:transcription initiation factor IIF auxiliary subunit
MTIVLTSMYKGGEHTLEHDLNFQTEKYEAKHTVVSSARSALNQSATMLIRTTDFPKPEARTPGIVVCLRPYRRRKRCARQG